MSEAARTVDGHFTWNHYRQWPDTERWEIIGGEAFAMSPAPSLRHQEVLGDLYLELRQHFKGKICSVYMAPTDVKCSNEDIVQPDLLVVCEKEKIKGTHIEGAPTLVVEILSPSTASFDRVRKMPLYARSGVKEVWLVTPYPWLAEVYALDGESYRLARSYERNDTLTSVVFPELHIALAKVFDFEIPPEERSLQTKQSYTVGVAAQLDNAGVTGPMLKAIVDGLREARYMALFCDCSSGAAETRRVLRRMHSRRVDGIILHAEMAEHTLADVFSAEIPVIAVRCDEGTVIPCVVDERRQAFVNGVQWLAERGHRRIAFLGRDNRQALANPHNTHRLKIAGYQDAMRRRGLYDEALLLDADCARGAARELVLARDELFRSLTAVLACSDQTAVEVLSGLAELGLRVPEDCSVIGFDDTDFAAAVRPRLTTFRPRRAEVGTKAVELLLRRMKGEEVDSVTLVPELIERESAGEEARSAREAER